MIQFQNCKFLISKIKCHDFKIQVPQNGDSTGDSEGQARIQIRENVAFDYLINRYLFLCFFFVYLIIGGTFESFDLLIELFTC